MLHTQTNSSIVWYAKVQPLKWCVFGFRIFKDGFVCKYVCKCKRFMSVIKYGKRKLGLGIINN